MKGKMTVIIAGTLVTMLVVTGFISSASARNLRRNNGNNKPLHPERAGTMRNSYKGNLNAGQQQSVRFMINDLEFGDLQGVARSGVENRGGMRIDRQGQTGNAQNIQVQVNGQRGGSTVATVLIPNRYLNNSLNRHGRGQVTNRVRNALRRSFFDFLHRNPTNYRLGGSISN